MTNRTSLITAFALLCMMAGCQQASGPGLQVQVRAEPKQGYKPPAPEDTGYLPADDPAVLQSHDHAYHLIDYRKLEGVVVCLEPLDGQTIEQTAPAVPDIEVGERVKAKGDVYVTQAGPVTFRNNGSKPQTVLIRSALGVDPLEIVPGGAAAQAFDARVPRGPVEVLRDQDDEPLAYVYLSPSPLVRVARGGERVTFAPLTPGKYRVTTWHPILPGSSKVVDVGPGKMSKLTLTVGVNSLPEPSR